MASGNKIDKGEVWTKDDKIVFVGNTDNISKTAEMTNMVTDRWDREIDCEGNLLMPGFKDAHTHSGMTIMRSLADDLPLQDWLTKQVFPIEAKLDEEKIYHLTRLAILEYLTSGITSIMDMYLTPESIAKACAKMGMRCVQVGNVNNFSSSVQYMEEMYKELNHTSPLLSYLIGFHAEYTCSKELLVSISDLAHKYEAPVFTHVSETDKEVEECKGRYQMTPPAFLDSIGMFDYGGGAYHCVHVTENDIDIFRKKNVSVITNPGSNTKLASGIAPISAFLKHGVNVAIGTDGPASNNCLDMFREMFLVTGLAKLRENDASAVPAFDVLKMATVNGAKAMHLDKCDTLTEGREADIIMIDLHQPNMQPINNIANNIVYSGSKSNVKMTMIAGNILYESGKFADNINAREIYDKASEITEELCGERS